MKTLFRPGISLALMVALAALTGGCGGSDDPAAPEPTPPTILKILVASKTDSALIQDANVVLYQAETREAVTRGLTGPDGVVFFDCEAGNYYVSVSAQGYAAVPRENIAPVPFYVAREDTTVDEIDLNALEAGLDMGWVQGYIEPAMDNFLVLAEAMSSQASYAAVSGPDGFFVIHNMPFDDYALDALKSGYAMDAPVVATVSAQAWIDSVRIPVSAYVGSTLTGSVTFLASENSVVDITLLDPRTRSVVPGLTVMNDEAGLNYRIDAIPDGEYLAWASLRNDGYVVDPDWIFKNPGGLDVAFTRAGTVELNFSVTDAIPLVSPTNPADSTYAVMAASAVPTFRWQSYPSAKEYFIEVKDLAGNTLWGGFNDDGTVNHDFIAAGATNVTYNFDNKAGVPALVPGEIYQWRIWADKGTMADSFVEQLISASEDLVGLFQVPAAPTD